MNINSPGFEDALDADESLGYLKDPSNIKRALLPGELWQTRCRTCNKLAIRLFKPRNDLAAIEEQEGIAGVMKRCGSTIKSRRILMDTPLFNLVLTGGHSFSDGYDLSTFAEYGCMDTIAITDKPSDIIWHIFSRMRIIRATCLINGISYQEVKDWFYSLDISQQEMIIPHAIRIEPIIPNQSIEGNWNAIWIHAQKLQHITPVIFSRHTNGDPAWDHLDPVVTTQEKVRFIEYNSDTSTYGDMCVDSFQLEGQLPARLLIEPRNRPGQYFAHMINLSKKRIIANLTLSHMVHIVPSQYWIIDPSRISLSIIPVDDPRMIRMDE